MECTYCGEELTYEDSYGNKEYIIYGTCPKSGDIYSCPNHVGFDDEESAMEYLKETEQTMESLDVDTWGEIVCDSSTHHVSGSFYTDSSDNLYEGYPC